MLEKMIVPDKVSELNRNTKHSSALREVTIGDLKLGQIQKDTILWLETINRVKLNAEVQLLTQDKKGECLMLLLYN